MDADAEALLRQILTAIDALTRRVEALERQPDGQLGNMSGYLGDAMRLLAKRAKREVPPDLSEKRRLAARVRWGEAIEGTRQVRLAQARARGQHTETEWLALLKICGFKCLRCGNDKVVKDHIVPIHADGASDSIDNIQPLCRPCNASKGRDHTDYRPKDWLESLNRALQVQSKFTANTDPEDSGIYDGSELNRLQNRSKSTANSLQNSIDVGQRKRKLSTGRPTVDGSPGEPEPETTPPALAGAKLWLSYSTAYKLRYGVFPVRNAKVNTLLKQFVSRVPMAEAPSIAEFYLSDNEPLYVKSAHCVTLMLRDAEKLRMAWATGRRLNGNGAGKPWWEVWSGIEAMGKELGIAPDEHPQVFRQRVLHAAHAAGRLPQAESDRLGLA